MEENKDKLNDFTNLSYNKLIKNFKKDCRDIAEKLLGNY